MRTITTVIHIGAPVLLMSAAALLASCSAASKAPSADQRLSAEARIERPSIDRNFLQINKLTGPDVSTHDGLGINVGIYKDTAIVSANSEEIGGKVLQGSAHIFERNREGAWGEVKKLIASDGGAQNSFGSRVAIYRDMAIVAAQAKAYIFERNSGGANNWGEVKKLTISDDGPFSVAIYEDTVIVGANGKAYIFERDQGGANNWGEVRKLIPPGLPGKGHNTQVTISKDRTQVAIYKDIAIVGKFKEKIGRNAGQGAAYIYERNHGGANNWGQVKELTASDGAAYDEFGSTVAIYADLAIVSAKGSNKTDKDGKFGRGGAYIFEQNKGGDNKWGEVRKLTSPVDIHVDSFGTSVAIYGDTAIVGTEAKNAAYIFSPKTTGR